MKNIRRAEVLASLLLELLDCDATEDGRYTHTLCESLETLAGGKASKTQSKFGRQVRSLYEKELKAEAGKAVEQAGVKKRRLNCKQIIADIQEVLVEVEDVLSDLSDKKMLVVDDELLKRCGGTLINIAEAMKGGGYR